jgi:Ser/Thr protein kinase RdoA (MazF antagonist)
VPQVCRRKNGQYYKAVQIAGQTRYLGVVEWLNGQVLHDVVEHDSNASALTSHLLELGGIMAQTHNQATSWQIPQEFERHQWNVEGFLGVSPHWGKFWEVPQLDDEQRQIINQVREYLIRRLNDYGERPQTYSMIHADMHHGNLMKVDDHITVIDFDDAGFGWHLYDMAVAIYHFQDRENFADIQSAIVEGYRRHRQLADADVARLPDFLLLRNVAILGWIYGRTELDQGDRLPSLVDGICRVAKKIGIAA